MTTSVTPHFPPLMTGLDAQGGDPFALACQKADLGVEAGLIAYDLGASSLRAALVLAPEVPLSQAMTMLPLCAVGFQNALGALAPPEVAVHLEWNGKIRVNGAGCGRLNVCASHSDPKCQPDWLVIGLDVPLWPSGEGGEDPDSTALYAEGCADVSAPALLEAWARHCLHWIHRWDEGELRTLHTEWRGMAHGVGEDITETGQSGTFLGVDEDFGLLLRNGEGATQVVPLTDLLEDI